MDPVTHALVGAAAGLTILAASQGAQAAVAPSRDAYKQRWVAALCGLLGGELPDVDRVIDIFYKGFGEDGQGLTYMLWHRGPTHTLVACLLTTPVLALLTRAVARRVSPPLGQLIVIAAVGQLLHLAMDGMNDYGVHPFPPLSQRWFYGDFLFLAEPTVWAALLPYILRKLGVNAKHLLIASASSSAVVFAALILLNQWLTPFGAVLALLCMIGQALLQRRGPRPIVAWASVLAVLAGFLFASRVARQHAIDWIARLAPQEHVSDVVTTPAPANPFCWRVITVTHDGDSFVARMGMVSFWPALVQAKTCYAPPNGLVPSSVCAVQSLPKANEAERASSDVWQFAEFAGTFRDFERKAVENPRVGATRHYLRVPFWGRDDRSLACEHATQSDSNRPPPKRMLIGDLRVDYSKEDVGEFCKYPFPSAGSEPYAPFLPVGDPPFFKTPPESPTAH